jgi:hypothetical protein
MGVTKKKYFTRFIDYRKNVVHNQILASVGYGNLWEATARFVRVTFNKLLNFYGWDFYLHNEFKFLLGLHIKKISLEFFSIWEFSQQF